MSMEPREVGGDIKRWLRDSFTNQDLINELVRRWRENSGSWSGRDADAVAELHELTKPLELP